MKGWLTSIFLISIGAGIARYISTARSIFSAKFSFSHAIYQYVPAQKNRETLPFITLKKEQMSAMRKGGNFTPDVADGSTLPSDDNNCRPLTRFLRLTNDPVGDILQVGEVEAYNVSGSDVAHGKFCTSSSIFDYFSCDNLVDGARDTFFHSASGARGEFVEVDLGKDTIVMQLVVYNRDDSTAVRMEGQTLILLDASRRTIAAFSLHGVREAQAFDASFLACPGHSPSHTITESPSATQSPTSTSSLSVGVSPPTPCTLPVFYSGFKWQYSDDGLTAFWQPPSLCPMFSVNEASLCLSGQHVLFIGDSVTRFQFTNLAYWLTTGFHEAPEGLNENRHNENVGGGWGDKDDATSWIAYFNSTQARLGLEREVCDCYHDFKKFGWPDFAAQCPTNRFWFGPAGSRIRLSYLQWWDKWPLLGHSPDFLGLPCFDDVVNGKVQAQSCRQQGCQAGYCSAPFHWSHPTTTLDERIEAMRQVVKRFKPTITIFSSMIWNSYDSPQGARDLMHIFKALQNDNPMLRIFWKTSAAVGDTMNPGHLFERDLLVLLKETMISVIDQSFILRKPMLELKKEKLKRSALYLYDHVHPTAVVQSAVNEATLMHLCRF